MTSTDYNEKARALVERIDTMLEELYGEEPPYIVLGIQFRGQEGGCVLSSNLPICAVGSAIHDMHDMAVEQHQAHHGVAMMPQSPDSVPDEVKDFAAKLAEDFGVDPSQIVYKGPVTTDDLNDEGIAELIGTRFDADQDVPTTVQESDSHIGDPDLGVPNDHGGVSYPAEGVISATSEEPDPEQRFESGSENEG